MTRVTFRARPKAGGGKVDATGGATTESHLAREN